MAMIICSECGSEVSDQAVACPKCGVNQSSIAMIEKIKENRKHPCKDNLPNLIHECDEALKEKWFTNRFVVFIYAMLSLVLIFFFYGSGFLVLAYIIYLEYKAKKDIKEALSRTIPCLKNIYPIVDANTITSKFDYVSRNEKLTVVGGDREKMDYMIYSRAYKLGADAIIINNQDTTTKTYGSVSTNRDMFFNKTIEGKTTTIAFDNVYVSYVKVKD